MWCIHNAIEFEKKGVPTATVCTYEFASLGRETARERDFPHLAIVSVPHPIGGIDLDQVRRKADNAFEDMVRILTMSSEELSEESKKQF